MSDATDTLPPPLAWEPPTPADALEAAVAANDPAPEPPPSGPEAIVPVSVSPSGRPSKFTPEVRHKILSAIRAGCEKSISCEYAGISTTTLWNWLKEAENPQAPPEYREFLDDMQQAWATAEVARVARLNDAGKRGIWQADLAWLERARPERWTRPDRSQVEISGPGGGPLDLRVEAGQDTLAMQTLAARLASRQAQADEDVVDAEVVIEEPVPVVPGTLGYASKPEDSSH